MYCRKPEHIYTGYIKIVPVFMCSGKEEKVAIYFIWVGTRNPKPYWLIVIIGTVSKRRF